MIADLVNLSDATCEAIYDLMDREKFYTEGNPGTPGVIGRTRWLPEPSFRRLIELLIRTELTPENFPLGKWATIEHLQSWLDNEDEDAS